jgi:phosphoribosylanthranilate isomerase
VKVKICGITRAEDAVVAALAGADAIGLVFYPPSSRCVSLNQAQQIAAATPPFVQRVALFVDASAAEVREVLEHIDIDLLQFHGDETPAYCEQFNKAYIKALPMRPDVDVVAQMATYPAAKGFLLDTYRPGVPGGTGETFNWQDFPRNCDKPLILAGGLTAENVRQAINTCVPYAVDVSGGVEIQRGVKSAELIKAFIDQAKSI